MPLGGFTGVSWVITPVTSHGLVFMFTKADLVAWELSGFGSTALALTTIPLVRATKCSPDVKCSPSHMPSCHHSCMTPPLDGTGGSVQDRCSEEVDFSREGTSFELFP